MTHTYQIAGMTCTGCVAKVKSELLKLGDVASADVQLASPQATITMQQHIPLTVLQSAIHKAGQYTITEEDGAMKQAMPTEAGSGSWLATYKPLLLVFAYLLAISLIAGDTAEGFSWMLAMRIFMSGFFLSFSFFKLLDLAGFADSYATYDIIARRYHAWGFIYPFIELALGLSYALDSFPLVTNLVAFVVMSVSIAGVLKAVLNKRKIRCACLGAVFNLPMSTVTIIEDALMIAMSGMVIVTSLF